MLPLLIEKFKPLFYPTEVVYCLFKALPVKKVLSLPQLGSDLVAGSLDFHEVQHLRHVDPFQQLSLLGGSEM